MLFMHGYGYALSSGSYPSFGRLAVSVCIPLFSHTNGTSRITLNSVQTKNATIRKLCVGHRSAYIMYIMIG